MADPAGPDELMIRPAARSDLRAIMDIYNDAIRTTTATFDLSVRRVSQVLIYGETADWRARRLRMPISDAGISKQTVDCY